MENTSNYVMPIGEGVDKIDPSGAAIVKGGKRGGR